MTVEWKEPPEVAGPKGSTVRFNRVLAELKSRPGDWAIVGQGVSSTNQYAWIKRGCEATSRKSLSVPGKYDIYARWPVES